MSDLDPFSVEWANALIAATADRASAGGLGGMVTLKGMRRWVTISFEDGRATAAVDEKSSTVLPFKTAQYSAWLAGELNLAEAYTIGDLRAEGPTGPLLAALEVLDDPAVVATLAR